MSQLSAIPAAPPGGGVRLLAAFALSTVFISAAVAGGTSDNGHAQAAPAPAAMTGGGHMDDAKGHTEVGESRMDNGKGHMEGDERHAHQQWVDPPPAYAGKRSDLWDDRDSLLRGHTVYEQQCAACHGVDGSGEGLAASGLKHTPADLTNHFHRGPGRGDDYLFWRVSEGGAVEPFKSQGSVMPAFKDLLTERQRWDVLTYVHFLFHRGFNPPSAAPHNDDGAGPHVDR